MGNEERLTQLHRQLTRDRETRLLPALASHPAKLLLLPPGTLVQQGLSPAKLFSVATTEA